MKNIEPSSSWMKIHNHSLSSYEEEVIHASCKIRGGLTRSLKTFEHIAPKMKKIK
jgi:hypothetical protein